MSPQFVDWNGDGHLDALLGGYAGDVLLFLGKADGGFRGGSHLTFGDGKRFIHTVGKNRDGSVKLDAGAMIWCVDWDQDGDLDILSGWFYGGLFLSRNVGSSTNPKLSATFEEIQSDGKSMQWGYQLQPCMVDWDGDGRKDVIYSSQVIAKSGRGSVSWCRNLSDSGEPRLGPSEVLVWSGSPSQIIAPELGLDREFAGFLAAVATDWDGDGAVDLIVGDMAWLSQPLPGLSEDGRQRLKEVSGAMKQQARPDAFLGMTRSESASMQRKLSGERSKVAKGMKRGTARGRLWLVRRRVPAKQK